MSESTDPVIRERERILGVYARRDAETGDLYAPWRPDEFFMRTGRRRVAVRLFVEAGVFPEAGDPWLEVGLGSLGWLGELISWGVRETDLHGIDLDPRRFIGAGRLTRGRHSDCPEVSVRTLPLSSVSDRRGERCEEGAVDWSAAQAIRRA